MNLSQKMRDYLPEQAIIPVGGQELFMEVMNPITKRVWMARSSVEKADFKTLKPGIPYIRSGLAKASMDMAAFIHSPGREKVLTKTIGGYEFINVAKFDRFKIPKDPAAPVKITVHKNHVIGFEAGRELTYLSMPDGLYIEVIGTSKLDEQFVLPEGGKLGLLTPQEPLIVHLPTPTKTYFWGMPGTKFAGKFRSFQGPVELPII